jgi:hypothetical protein
LYTMPSFEAEPQIRGTAEPRTGNSEPILERKNNSGQ